MNIWRVNFNVEKYMWCVFNETESMNLLQFAELFFNEEILSEKLPKEIVFHNKDDENKNPPADMMMCSGTCSGIVNDRVKKMLESQYDGVFHFYRAHLKELPNEIHYILVPAVYLYAEEVLDLENTDIDYVCDDVIFKIRRYVFTTKVKKNHFFRMIFNNGKIKMYNWLYCDDKFKNFIEKNDITGLKFKKIYEFED